METWTELNWGINSSTPRATADYKVCIVNIPSLASVRTLEEGYWDIVRLLEKYTSCSTGSWIFIFPDFSLITNNLQYSDTEQFECTLSVYQIAGIKADNNLQKIYT